MRDAFFNSLYNVIKQDKQVVILASDTGALVLDNIRRDQPESCINVGIAEENMIGVAAGLAVDAGDACRWTDRPARGPSSCHHHRHNEPRRCPEGRRF